MEHTSEPGSSGARRRLLRRPLRIPDGGESSDLTNLLIEYAQALDRRLDAGLRELHKSAALLMRQLAAEVWRASGPGATKNLREGVVSVLARDDAMRGVLAHTDERFQLLASRVDRMETGVRRLAEAVREVVRHVNDRSADLGRVAHAAARGPEAVVRLERAVEPLAARLEATTARIQRAHERQREDLAGFAETTARSLTENHKRIEGVLRGEIQRLEAAMLSERAFAGESAADLRQQVEGVAERTGIVLDGMRTDLLTRLEGDRERVERLGTRQQAALEGLDARAREGLAEASRGIEDSLRATTEQAAAARREVLEHIGRIEEAQEREQEKAAGFMEHIRRVLQEMTRRTQEGLKFTAERSAAVTRERATELEGSVKSEFAELSGRMDDIAERTGSVLEGVRGDVERRLEAATGRTRDEAIQLVTELVTRQGGQQARNLQAITDSLQEVLTSAREAGAQQAAEIGELLRASAGRQEALVEEALAALRSSVSELGASYERTDDGEAAAFSRRLRSVEERLARLSRELADELP